MKSQTPLYDAITKYTHLQPVPFHMPGHKLGAGLPEEFARNMASFDLTEIPGTDHLHYPAGAIAEAQKLAAETFGAEETFFLVNGSTCGIQAMILSVCKQGDRLIVARDCHKSVINALLLAGAEPVYLRPEGVPEFGIAGAATPEAVREAWQKCPEALGILITCPNYYGICSNIKEIAEITHAFGKLLLVDEAHGAHLAFHPALPESAMAAGVDLCVQSAHKTLNALTQGAYLHVRGQRADREKLRYYLSILQTSSPSYIIMASLDLARAQMGQQGRVLLGGLLSKIFAFKKQLSELKDLKMLTPEALKSGKLDETRLVICVKGLGITGFQAEELLRAECNIQVEMSDFFNIVCIATVADSNKNFLRLLEGCFLLREKFKNSGPLTDIYPIRLSVPEQRIPLSKTAFCKGKEVSWENAVNQVSLDLVTPYPPGIPVLYPGEVVSFEIQQYVRALLKSGGKVNGLGNKGEIRVAE